MPLTDYDDSKIAFNEEKENLVSVEGRIEAMISLDKEKLHRSYDVTAGWRAIDNEDRQRKAEALSEQRKLQEHIEKLNEYIDSPYFGHMEVMAKGEEPHTFFVGKEGLSKGPEIIILDWRSSMGNKFYDKQQRSFNVEGIDYDLALRRAVDIKNAKLVSVKTEYDLANLSLEGEVIDEFLISVLRDKRRNYKLTDIIRTIQENQNQLIRRPLDESFIIQGCAGSGKTMILLHRLSYIAFNHPKTDFNRYYILTPNENFNLHISDLSKSLGLDQIKRYTVEAFYAALINGLAHGDYYISKSRKNEQKLTASAEKLKSEKLLDTNLLETVYSKRFHDEIISEYQEKSDAAIDKLSSLHIAETLRKYNRPVKELTRMDFRAYSALHEPIEEILSKHSEAYKRIKGIEEELQDAMANLEKNKQTETNARSDAASEKNALQALCEQRIAELESKLSTANEDLRIQNSAIEAAKQDKASIFERIQTIDVIPKLKDQFEDPAAAFEMMLSSNDELILRIKSICEEEFNAAKDAHAQLDSLAFYNFGRRARIRSDVENTERTLAEKALSTIQAIAGDAEEDGTQLRSQIAALDDTITGANLIISNALAEIRNDTPVLNAYKACRDALLGSEYPDISKAISSTDMNIVSEICKGFIQKRQQYEKASRNLSASRDQVSRLQSDAAKLNQEVLEQDDLSSLSQAAEIVCQFDIRVLYKNLEERLKGLYKQFDQKYLRSTNYRHILYLKLLLCSLYYSLGTEVAYNISIDEAQDLAVMEYTLLRAVLGEKTVFNLYGDVNQTVYEYKGISDWGDLSNTISSNIYFLNENYRNTIQITKFCNDEFEADITAIGLSGEEIRRVEFDQAIEMLAAIHKGSPELRTAILYKRGLSGLEEALKKVSSTIFSFNSIDPRSISVITVEEAKGLEFDAVVTVENYMNVNERYISFTRALDNLIITELPESGFVRTIDDADENPQEETEDDEPTVDEFAEDPIEEESKTVAVIEDEVLPELSDSPINISVDKGSVYSKAYFKGNSAFADAFINLASYAEDSDPEIMIRVSSEYIGLAKPDEKTRLYVSNIDGREMIRYRHLYSKEEYSPELMEHYKRLYDQCALHVKQYPIPLKSANRD